MDELSPETIVKKLLELCKKSGYKFVSIHQKCDKIRSSKTWSDKWGYDGNVFVYPSKNDASGFPAIWGIIAKLNISGGAGNSDQHQIILECEPQSWQLVDKKWIRIDVSKPA